MASHDAGSIREFLGLEGPLAIAHRGGGAERPENTMAAFENAVTLGYRCVETDVRATRDRVVVVYHDEDLDRLTSETGPLGVRDWRDLKSVRVDGAEPIPRLEDVLGTWPDLRLIVDPKADDVVAPLIEVFRRTNARERVCVGSFSAHRLRWIRTDAPGYTSCSPFEVVRLRAESWSFPLGTLEADCAQVPPRQPLFGDISIPVVDAAFVRAAHARGMPVQVWTVDEEAEMERLLDLGVDGVMSDHLTTLKAVFERRGLWG
ncbi:MAG: glycerophosphodiester phosphodiesterase family protein [Gammaproteobacteria bacterium]|nr:glycerophosphodiester phosphodiesterase family protein [Gammaproteobacteria bacterium]